MPELHRLHWTRLLAFVFLAGCGAREADPWGAAAFARLTPRERVAQLLVVPLDSSAGVRIRLPGAGGVQVTGGAADEVRLHVAALQRMAPRPLLVVADLTRGAGGVVAGATELPPASRLASDRDAVDAARIAAAEARALGVNVARLPGPALSPEAAPRGAAPLEVYAAALEDDGIAAIPLAFGPHRPAASPVAWDRAALEAGPLRVLARAPAGGVELAWTAVPALTGDSTPLPLSPVAAAGLLRRDLGFTGVLVADVGEGSPWRDRFGARAPVAAVVAGADLLLGVDDPVAAVDSLLLAVEAGRLGRARLEEAARRVFALKATLRLRPVQDTAQNPGPLPPVAAPEGAALASRLEGAALLQGGTPAALLRRCGRVAIATPWPDSAAVLAAEVIRRFPGARVVRADTVPQRGDPGWAGADPDCVLVVHLEEGAPVVVAGREPPPADTARPVPARRIIRLFLGDPPAERGPADAWAAAAGRGARAQERLAALLAGEVTTPPGRWPPARVLARAPADSAGMRADSLRAIDDVIRAALEQQVFTAAAVAVGRRGRLVKLSGYGRTAGDPVRPDSTLFDVASLTKVVGTTAAVMALVDDSVMELAQPLRRYLPAYRGGARSDVTVRHLLNHTGGLPPGANLYAGTRSPEAALRRVARAEPRTPPGERTVYSDFGMILLGAAVERQAEEPLDQFLARRVFAPLGMQATGYRPAVMLQDRIVPTALRSERPYTLDGVVHDGNAFRLGGVAGHAGLFSTAADLAVFAQAILNGGAYGEREVWSAQTVRTFTTAPRPGARALGWDVPGPRSSAGDYFSARSFGHTGYTGTSLWLDPERDLFVVLLTNRTYDRGSQEQIYRVRRRVHDLAARAISDQQVQPRPGTAAAERSRPRRPPARRPQPRRPGRRG